MRTRDMPARLRRPVRFGVAIGTDAVTIVTDGGAPVVVQTAISPLTHGAEEWPGLRDALEAAREATGSARPVATVSLLPPLVALKRVELPRLREAERRMLLTRDIGRYFPNATDRQVVASSWSRGDRREQDTTLVAVASARAIEAIGRAARDAGWTLDGIVPAHEAWARAGRELWPELRRNGGWLVLATSQGDVALELQTGRLRSVRRVPRSRSNAQELDRALCDGERDEGATKPAVAFVGAEARRRELEEAIGRPSVLRADQPADAPDVLAARFAAKASPTLELVDQAERVRRATRARRTVMALCAASVVALMCAASVELWGVRREIAGVRAHRAAIASEVSRAMTARGALDSTTALLATLREREATAPRWSGVIAELSERLPLDASLTALHARGDTILMEGSSAQASGVFESLQSSLRLSGARPDAPIRRERGPDGESFERFTASARVTRRAIASPNEPVLRPAGGGH